MFIRHRQLPESSTVVAFSWRGILELMRRGQRPLVAGASFGLLLFCLSSRFSFFSLVSVLLLVHLPYFLGVCLELVWLSHPTLKVNKHFASCSGLRNEIEPKLKLSFSHNFVVGLWREFDYRHWGGVGCPVKRKEAERTLIRKLVPPSIYYDLCSLIKRIPIGTTGDFGIIAAPQWCGLSRVPVRVEECREFFASGFLLSLSSNRWISKRTSISLSVLNLVCDRCDAAS